MMYLLAQANVAQSIQESPSELAKKAAAASEPMSVVTFTAGLCCCLFVFGLLILALIAWRYEIWGKSPMTTRLFGMTIILILAAILLAAGFGKDQLAVFSGAFGMALGFLFGKSDPKEGS